MTPFNIALTENDDAPGQLMAHRPECPVVATHRVEGRMIMTMMGCVYPIPKHVTRHSCLGWSARLDEAEKNAAGSN